MVDLDLSEDDYDDYYPGEPREIDEEISRGYLDILECGDGANFNSSLSDDEYIKRLERLDVILAKIMHRHLSDSPSSDDKQKFIVELLETALKIAKGEMKV